MLTHAGFAFGEEERVVYLSDLSSLPADSIEELASRPIHILVLDALLRKLLLVYLSSSYCCMLSFFKSQKCE
jgi:hypothetical protein